MPCEYRFLCGEKNCDRNFEECRELLMEKLTEQKAVVKRQEDRFAQEIAAAKKAEVELGIHFICDRRNCGSCDDFKCCYTTNIRHAANFHMEGEAFFENNYPPPSEKMSFWFRGSVGWVSDKRDFLYAR